MTEWLKRQARCSYCQRVTPSNDKLPFFQDRGEDSKHATETCKCGYYKSAHDAGRVKCLSFVPGGAHEFDGYYCGCRGWD